MKTYVINPKPGQSFGPNVTVGKCYTVLGEISGYDNVIFDDADNPNHCNYAESVVVIYDAHTMSNRQAWWVKHLVDVPCVTVVLVGDTSNIRSILNEGAIVVDDSHNLSLNQLLAKAGR